MDGFTCGLHDLQLERFSDFRTNLELSSAVDFLVGGTGEAIIDLITIPLSPITAVIDLFRGNFWGGRPIIQAVGHRAYHSLFPNLKRHDCVFS